MNDKLFLANLITYRARSFASALARGLALTATGTGTLFHARSGNGLNMLHD